VQIFGAGARLRDGGEGCWEVHRHEGVGLDTRLWGEEADADAAGDNLEFGEAEEEAED
jgi:hypothetical protein